jgi:ComF family protein
MNRSDAHPGWRLLQHWLEAGLELLFPLRCAGCGRAKQTWCHDCDRSLRRLTGHLCTQCGIPLQTRSVCRSCSKNSLPLIARSYARYERPLIRAILQLKYRPNAKLASVMANWLVGLYSREKWKVDLVVPVPLGRDRLYQRGYNQAGLIAFALAKMLDLSYSDKALQRIRETKSQVGLDSTARMQNVRGAFQADGTIVNGKTILIVDDLFTTGATLSACALSLLESGANKVYGLTVSRAHSNTPIG